MPYEIEEIISNIDPLKTILFFGAGASIPSGGPSVTEICSHLSKRFNIEDDSLSLQELSSVIEQKYNRKEMIFALRELFKGIKPTGGILNLPLYSWRSIFTTNYDDIIEKAYLRKREDIYVFSSNFDFNANIKPNAAKLFKIHGSIEKDAVDGHASRLIISDADYDYTEDYRQQLFDRLKADMSESHLIIIGYSLSDSDVKLIIERAIKIKACHGGTCRISLLMYSKNETRAALMEKRGVNVCFGGVDDFFALLATKGIEKRSKMTVFADNIVESVPQLPPLLINVSHKLKCESDFSKMFNGSPASYADIQNGLTFSRSKQKESKRMLLGGDQMCLIVLGASGVGKTTFARQVLTDIASDVNHQCWEHIGDYSLPIREWHEVAVKLKAKNKIGVLFIDDAHFHLRGVSDLVDGLMSDDNFNLKIVLCSSKNFWYPRVKSPGLYKHGNELILSRLDEFEIDNLLYLANSKTEISRLIENGFSGFSRHEQRRRLMERCGSDMFVCLRNIFANEKFDDIVLKEFAELPVNAQEIYRLVSAMESSGIRVHRQLVIRLFNVDSNYVGNILCDLSDIVFEYCINEREGIFGWKCRHAVIAKIIRDYKYQDVDLLIELFVKIIDGLLPTYEIEVKSLVDLCSSETGVEQIPNRETQNMLFRKMISVAPAERIPRHRLIRNLIESGEFDKADTEIRIFEKDFKLDGPVARYKINIMKERATSMAGLLLEDRQAILSRAQTLSLSYIKKFPNNKYILAAYCDVGLAYYQLIKDSSMFDEAIDLLKKSEEKNWDSDIRRLVSKYEKQISLL